MFSLLHAINLSLWLYLFFPLVSSKICVLNHDRRRNDGLIDLRAILETDLERITVCSKIVSLLVDIKAGGTLIRRFKREPHTLLYVLGARPWCLYRGRLSNSNIRRVPPIKIITIYRSLSDKVIQVTRSLLPRCPFFVTDTHANSLIKMINKIIPYHICYNQVL